MSCSLRKINAKCIARLGVGASIPEGYNSTSRETTRLKGKLAGTKHSREEDEDIASQQASDTEGESRAIAIKTKSKYDPFDVVHGKKKKKEKDIDDEDANRQLILASSQKKKRRKRHRKKNPLISSTADETSNISSSVK